MSLVTTEAPNLITIREQDAVNLTCPFTRSGEFNDYVGTYCKTTDCMAWIKVVDVHINDTRICPAGYEDITPEMYDALYGNEPQEFNKFFFVAKDDKKNKKGYCLRLKGCLNGI